MRTDPGTVLSFVKMEGAGNDFVVFDAFENTVGPTPALARRLADRRLGVGADQVLWVGPTGVPGADFAYRIFNADGSEAEMCGNGARAVAAHLARRGLLRDGRAVLSVKRGLVPVSVSPEGNAAAVIGRPDFSTSTPDFRMGSDISHSGEGLPGFPVPGSSRRLHVVTVGNPHAVTVVGSEEEMDVLMASAGALLQKDPRFPNAVNAGFLLPVTRTRALLKVWERGTGPTPSCGTGASAAAAVGMALGLFDRRVSLEMPGGTLTVEALDGGALELTGPVSTVFEGRAGIPGELFRAG